MAFLNFMKKREELPADIDLDVPPEPPKMMKEEISAEGPINEELMPLRKTKPKKLKIKAPKVKKEISPEIPLLPKVEEELPPLPGEITKEFGEEGLDLPPPPESKKEKKGFLSFLKPKKVAELPKIEEEIPVLPEIGEEIPAFPSLHEEEKELPPLPEIGEEFPAFPSLPEETHPMPELKKEMPIAPQPTATPPFPEMPAPETLKPAEKPLPEKEKPIKKFITIDNFRQIQSNISDTKGILNSIDDFFSRSEEVKTIRDKQYSELHNSLQDTQRKLMFVDKTLFEEV